MMKTTCLCSSDICVWRLRTEWRSWLTLVVTLLHLRENKKEDEDGEGHSYRVLVPLSQRYLPTGFSDIAKYNIEADMCGRVETLILNILISVNYSSITAA